MDKIRILLAEDDARTRMLLSDVLSASGYEVTCAPDGEAARELLLAAQTSHTPYHVVITDLIMHGVDGIEVLRCGRSQQPPAEVILLTGFGSLVSAIDALRVGAYDYLLKPCKAAQLLACVAGAVEQWTAAQRKVEAIQIIAESLNKLRSYVPLPTDSVPMALSPSPAVAPTLPQNGEGGDRYLYEGRLRLDRFRYHAFFDDQQIPLTPIEYSLLFCLLEAQGRVLSYQEIVRHTHNYETTSAEAQTLLKAHIYHLRRKIDPTYLVNVRGVGYMLSASQRHEAAG